MRRLIRWFALRVTWLATAFVSSSFRRALASPEAAQERVRRRLVGELARTGYGRSLGVKGGESLERFRELVPIVDYDALEPWLKRQREDERGGGLIVGGARFYERTSGSSGVAKLIPYSSALLGSFSRMFIIWARDLFGGLDGLGRGSVYFSISPSFGERVVTEGGREVGLEDDREYLPGVVRWLLGGLFLDGAEASRARSTEEFLRASALSLVRCGELQVISIWSPTFLEVILDYIEKRRLELAEEIGDERGELLRSMEDGVDLGRLWPDLLLLSLWADGPSRGPSERLAARFPPSVVVQGKGLLSTEAPVTVPLLGVEGQAPMLQELFLEFEGGSGELRLLHELELGGRYGVIVSTAGGLTRYRTGDIVEVVGAVAKSPTVRFCGRGGRLSDMVGEKLSAEVVEMALEEAGLGEAFATLVPVDGEARRYGLLTDGAGAGEAALAASLKSSLRRAHHYDLARKLGQLEGVEVVSRGDARELAMAMLMEDGRSIGGAKHERLTTRPITRERWLEMVARVEEEESGA